MYKHPRENRSTKDSASLATVLINFVFYYSSTSLILYQRRNVFKLQLKDFGGLTKTNVIWASSPQQPMAFHREYQPNPMLDNLVLSTELMT